MGQLAGAGAEVEGRLAQTERRPPCRPLAPGAVAVGTELRPSELAVMNIALDVVERMLPELPVERAITSGYLECDEPRVDGWHRLERRARDGWAADLLELRP